MRHWEDKEGWLTHLLDSEWAKAVVAIIVCALIGWLSWWAEGYRLERAARIFHEHGVTVPTGGGK